MYGRNGLDRFRKAQSSEPFSVTNNNSSTRKTTATALPPHSSSSSSVATLKPVEAAASSSLSSSAVAAQTGGGQSSWQPPDWAIEPRPGVYYLEVLKEGVVLDRINLDKKRHIFGRQIQTCDFVLDHTSVSRQHAAVVPHKNGSLSVPKKTQNVQHSAKGKKDNLCYSHFLTSIAE